MAADDSRAGDRAGTSRSVPGAEPDRSAATARSHAGSTVALVISNLEFGGAERQVVELANQLPDEGFDVHVVSLSEYVPLAANLAPGRATLHVVAKRSKYDVGLIFRLAKLLRSIRADVAHGFLFDAEIATRLAGRLAGVPAIIGSERNADYAMPARKRMIYAATAFALDACVANSNAGADFNSRVVGQPRSKYHVVYNGVDTARFHPRNGAAARGRIGVPRDCFCVGVFGSFKPQKNHLLFFAAAAKILSAVPEACFLVVGDSLEGGRRDSAEYKRRVVEYIEESGLAEHCVFLGNRTDIEEIYSACDVTVLPSLHEGTPNVALESMASAVPVVATNVSDNRFVIPDGEAGFIVPLDDVEELVARIVQLHAEPATRARMGANARRWTEHRFSLARLAKGMAEVYRQVMRRKRRANAVRSGN